jgi:DNA-binding NarL/FixJ family response regulator
MSRDSFAGGTGDRLIPPTRLQDRYRLVERIGEGAMGIVYRAHDDTLERDVAIKFLLPERIGGGRASARFLREARVVAQLSHPNIITLYDVDRQGDWHYLVLEYVPGQNLHDLMAHRQRPFPVPEALHAVRGVLEALAYAHVRGVIHRDVKPENIMLTPQGQVKVTDFGLALARGDVRLTREGMIVGTVLYLSPEVISGAAADARADLYAVGAVLYELITGRPPFCGDDPLSILSQILNAPLTPPSALVVDVPLQVERVVLTLLARDPGERYGSAQEVLDTLRGDVPQSGRVSRPAAARDDPRPSPDRPRQIATKRKIRILLVDDQSLFREGLRTLLSVQLDFEIVGEAGNGEQALRMAETYRPDVVLMDLHMPLLDGVAATRRLHAAQPDCRVIVLTTFDDDEHIFEGLRAGAVGYLLKDVASETLFDAVRAAARGESILQPSVAAKVIAQFTTLAGPSAQPSQPLVEPLSEREREVLGIIAEGKSNKEIAAELYITEGTVKNHVTNILGKLGVRDRTQAALKARDLGLI